MKSGIDASAIDPSVRPQDDLFRHVNGKWLATAEIPADRARDGEFMRLYDQAEKDVRAIIDELSASDHAEGTDAAKIATLYRDFMDEGGVEAAGVRPIQGLLEKVDAVTDVTGFIRCVGELQRIGIGGPIGAWVDTDHYDSSRYILNISQGGLGLPDESYYHEEQFAPIREAYVKHVQKMMELAGAENAAEIAASVEFVENRLADNHWDRVKARDVTQSYNPVDRAGLSELSPRIDWDEWISGVAGQPRSLVDVVVRQPSFLTALSDALGDIELRDWTNWLRWHVVHSLAPYLTSELVNENFAFYGTTLTGTPQLRERWKRGVGLVESALGDAIGQQYVARHFPPDSKSHAERLVAAILEAYRQDIEQLPWMTEETKAKALAKLATFNPKIGYPNKWRDYSTLDIVPGDLVGNVGRASAYEADREFAKLGSEVDRDEWFMLPQTVNAYYNPGMNEIVFPAAILQPPFFDPEAEDAVNFGGIGAVIAHEVSHGFDDQGSKYDGAGMLNNWWTESDRAEFDKRAQGLIEQFNELETAEAPGHKVNGALTVGENIGDLGGLKMAAKAYLISLDGKEAPVIDGLTGMQRLLFGWAQVWRGKCRPEEAIRLLSIDPHSPMDLRCNGVVRNLPEFYEAFDLTDSDALWLDPKDRVEIW